MSGTDVTTEDKEVYNVTTTGLFNFRIDKNKLFYADHVYSHWKYLEKKYIYYIFDIDLEEEYESGISSGKNYPFSNRAENVIKIKDKKNIKTAKDYELKYSSKTKPLLINSIKKIKIPIVSVGISQSLYVPHGLKYKPHLLTFRKPPGYNYMTIRPQYLSAASGVGESDIRIQVYGQFYDYYNDEFVSLVIFMEGINE
jgi:hypothetical protein